jgi:DNA primase
VIPQLENRIEFIREVVDLRSLLSELGIDVVREDGPELVALCPYHDDRNPSWSINSDQGSERWGAHSCWSCKDEDDGGRGTLFNLVMHVKRCSFKQALEWTERFCGLDGADDRVLDLSLAGRIREVKHRKQKRSGHGTVARQFESFPNLKQGSAGWRYLERRGLTRRQILESKVRKGTGRYAKRVVFPIFRGLTIVNFYARHIADNGKLKGLNAKGKGLINEALFNMHKADPLRSMCHLSEGAFDALAIERAGGVNSFGTNGGTLLEGQASLLRPYRRVVIVDDQKGDGVSLVPSCKRLLQDKELFRVVVPKGNDPDSTDPEVLVKLLVRPESLRRSRVYFVVDYSLPR